VCKRIDSVVSMEVDSTRWRQLQELSSVKGRQAPKAVVVALASVAGDSDTDRMAVWPSMATTASTTTWSCWIVTERSLGHVRIEYEKYLYDLGDEAVWELAPSDWSAWVRPIANVIGFRFGPFYPAHRQATIFEPAERVVVTFPDGDVNIPDGPVPVDQRANLGRIIEALRAAVNF